MVGHVFAKSPFVNQYDRNYECKPMYMSIYIALTWCIRNIINISYAMYYANITLRYTSKNRTLSRIVNKRFLF